MSIRLILAATAALAVAAPAFAQTAPAPAPAPAAAAAPAPSPEELAIQAKAQAFGMTVQAMVQEMMAAPDDAAADGVVAKYQPQITGFASDVDAFFAQAIARETDATKKASLEHDRAEAATELGGLAQKIKTEVRAQANAPAAPATPPAPQ